MDSHHWRLGAEARSELSSRCQAVILAADRSFLVEAQLPGTGYFLMHLAITPAVETSVVRSRMVKSAPAVVGDLPLREI